MLYLKPVLYLRFCRQSNRVLVVLRITLPSLSSQDDRYLFVVWDISTVVLLSPLEPRENQMRIRGRSIEVLVVGTTCRFRVGAIWFAYRLATIGYIDGEYRHKCPFCNEMVRETPEHLLLVCPRWRDARAEYLGTFIVDNLLTWRQLLGGSNLGGGNEEEVNEDLRHLWCPQRPRHIDENLLVPQNGVEHH